MPTKRTTMRSSKGTSKAETAKAIKAKAAKVKTAKVKAIKPKVKAVSKPKKTIKAKKKK